MPRTPEIKQQTTTANAGVEQPNLTALQRPVVQSARHVDPSHLLRASPSLFRYQMTLPHFSMGN